MAYTPESENLELWKQHFLKQAEGRLSEKDYLLVPPIPNYQPELMVPLQKPIELPRSKVDILGGQGTKRSQSSYTQQNKRRNVDNDDETESETDDESDSDESENDDESDDESDDDSEGYESDDEDSESDYD
jgi:hypothetical protein